MSNTVPGRSKCLLNFSHCYQLWASQTPEDSRAFCPGRSFREKSGVWLISLLGVWKRGVWPWLEPLEHLCPVAQHLRCASILLWGQRPPLPAIVIPVTTDTPPSAETWTLSHCFFGPVASLACDWYPRDSIAIQACQLCQRDSSRVQRTSTQPLEGRLQQNAIWNAAGCLMSVKLPLGG